MNNIDKRYTDLLQDILDNGVNKQTRNGEVLSVFGRQIRHDMKTGFPLLTTKKMAWKSIVTELLWFLRGDTNIKYLVDNNCHIWDGDCYKNYILKEGSKIGEYGVRPILLTKEKFINKIKTDDEFAEKWGDLGKIYGAQWRKWNGNGSPLTKDYEGNVSSYLVKPIDQIANLISELKTNPDSRRLMVNAWNVGELDQMTLPPCHYGFQVYTRELNLEERLQVWNIKFGFANEEQKNQFDPNVHLDTHGIPTRAISLMWNQRSVDTFLGLPFNIASYGLLLEIIAKAVNMVPDELIGNLGDVHLYSNHIEQTREQIGRKYTHEERTELLKQSMGEENYNKAVDELMPFGGGLSEYYESHKIPYSSREPFSLPKINFNSEWWDKPFFELVMNDNFCKCLLEEDIQLYDYQSHPTIKAPLSN
jgi:thymidylate synthase